MAAAPLCHVRGALMHRQQEVVRESSGVHRRPAIHHWPRKTSSAAQWPTRTQQRWASLLPPCDERARGPGPPIGVQLSGMRGHGLAFSPVARVADAQQQGRRLHTLHWRVRGRAVRAAALLRGRRIPQMLGRALRRCLLPVHRHTRIGAGRSALGDGQGLELVPKTSATLSCTNRAARLQAAASCRWLQCAPRSPAADGQQDGTWRKCSRSRKNREAAADAVGVGRGSRCN
mmetsp:Transcript_45441/g.119363  ORF Transcript_45441/g.119363 Transcript_45441/m.119363 type:complete len:231 (+) Transcript_45441:293-985(+)